MVQEMAERLIAECLVVPRVQDQLMPQIVRDLRGHGDELAAALQVSQKELAQRACGQLAILERQLGPHGLEFREYPLREHVSADVVRPRRLPQSRPDDQQRDAQYQRDDDEDGHDDEVLSGRAEDPQGAFRHDSKTIRRNRVAFRPTLAEIVIRIQAPLGFFHFYSSKR